MHISSESYGSRYLGGEPRASYKETTVWGVFQSFILIQRLRASGGRMWASKISALTQGIYSIFRSCFKKKFHFHHLPIRILRSFDRVCSWSVNGELYNPSFLLLGSWCSSAALLHQLGSLRWQAALVLPQKYYVKRLNTKLLNSSKKLKAEVCKCCIRTKHMFDINTLSWWHCNYQSKCGWWILLGTLYGW